ncbi:MULTISPECIES: chloramphenicol phosphotransferase CPT family protein [Gracilibacillus]|uniref:chloramphenicol phosphotransferase CPT family protein n=1 Tax=Gracilibacillus TaxID=74385 RepID=UPI0008259145|nr:MULTISPECIES: chloramphenicol phosphotransferase [Gracilibacillus]
MSSDAYGHIVILNGPPRSGKSSIVEEIQATFPGVWLNIGVDHYMKMIPQQFQPGIGLRPGGERPDLEETIVQMYQGLYQSIAAHSRLGLNVVVDVGHHDFYSQKRDIFSCCRAILQGLPVLLVGIHCPIDIIMKRRLATWGAGYQEDGTIPLPVQRWQHAVHDGHSYDVEIDTSVSSPAQSAALIEEKLRSL